MAVTDSIVPSFSDVEVTPHDGYITMTINGVEFNLETTIAYPAKGDLIRMTLGNETPAAGMQDTYRVLKIDGSIAEVMAMFDQVTSRTFGSNNTYAGSALDTYLNTTWYNNLSADAKSAIVAKSVQQYQYTTSSSAYNATTHASYANYSTKAAKGSAVSRNVYALDVEDIETYFGGTSSTAGTFSTANIWTLFWNTTSAPGTVTYPWLRSADTGTSILAFCVYGDGGRVGATRVSYGNAARPAFTIDLSKIEWSRRLTEKEV